MFAIHFQDSMVIKEIVVEGLVFVMMKLAKTTPVNLMLLCTRVSERLFVIPYVRTSEIEIVERNH